MWVRSWWDEVFSCAFGVEVRGGVARRGREKWLRGGGVEPGVEGPSERDLV